MVISKNGGKRKKKEAPAIVEQTTELPKRYGFVLYPILTYFPSFNFFFVWGNHLCCVRAAWTTIFLTSKLLIFFSSVSGEP